MVKPLIVVAISAANVRELFAPALQHFGMSSAMDKDIAAFYSSQIECPPVSPAPDFIVIRQIELQRSHLEKLRHIISQYNTLYVAHHEEDNFEENFSLGFECAETRICFQSYHREPTTDLLYQRILSLFECISKKKNVEALQKAQAAFIDSFRIDWVLEAEIKSQHEKIQCPALVEISNDTLVLWNENEFSEKLSTILGVQNVAISELEFTLKLNGKKKLLVLAELNWHKKNLSRFYGYEFANKLIAQNFEFDLAFVSCIDRETLKGVNKFTRLLAPIFPYFTFPAPGNGGFKITILPITSTKWSIIRNYYIRPDGIVDKLLHDIKKLTKFSDKKKISAVLENILSFSSILDLPIIKQTKKIETLIERKADYLGFEIRKLQGLLDDFYLDHLDTENKEAKPQKYPYQIMVVDDEEGILETLSEGLANYFNAVVPFTSGSEALSDLNKNYRSYSALIVDMLLLDNKGYGNWQKVQGSDLIEQARHYPHLAIYMITAYSKRALTNIQGKINLSEVNYISKDSTNGLPPEMSYKRFAGRLVAEVKKRKKFHDGPKLGIWKKGLLYFYYQALQMGDGDKLWGDVTATVELFIKNGESNDEEIIPAKLFHVDTRDFDLVKLRTVLLHRLINLYYQYREGSVNFQSTIRTVLGLQIKNAKQYYNSLLGLSAVIEDPNEKYSAHKIQKKGLFPEEIQWLKKIKPDAHSLKFPKLHQAIADALDYLPLQVKQQNRKMLSSIETLEDCLAVIKLFKQLPEKSRSDVAVDLFDYKDNYQTEYSLLKLEPEGSKIVEIIERFQ